MQYSADGVPVVNEDGRVTEITGPSNKLEYLIEIAEDRAGDPFVVYSYSAKTARFLAEGLKDAGHHAAVIEGATSVNDRQAYVQAFQAGAVPVLVITDAGAEGLTLTAADLIVFARQSWRAPTNQQVKDRIDRWGQERPPQTVVLLSKDTVDETRRLALEGKVEMQEQILRDKKRIKNFLTGKP